VVKEYSPEVIALRDRVKLGNEKLFLAWQEIKKIAHDTEEWKVQMDKWSQAQEKLHLLCTELTYKGFEDCLYLNEVGKKTRGCLSNPNGFWCQVCPSIKLYWERELLDLPGPKVRVTTTNKAIEQTEFLEKLGGKEK